MNITTIDTTFNHRSWCWLDQIRLNAMNVEKWLAHSLSIPYINHRLIWETAHEWDTYLHVLGQLHVWYDIVRQLWDRPISISSHCINLPAPRDHSPLAPGIETCPWASGPDCMAQNTSARASSSPNVPISERKKGGGRQKILDFLRHGPEAKHSPKFPNTYQRRAYIVRHCAIR